MGRRAPRRGAPAGLLRRGATPLLAMTGLKTRSEMVCEIREAMFEAGSILTMKPTTFFALINVSQRQGVRRAGAIARAESGDEMRSALIQQGRHRSSRDRTPPRGGHCGVPCPPQNAQSRTSRGAQAVLRVRQRFRGVALD